jgi:hypothetical protein
LAEHPVSRQESQRLGKGLGNQNSIKRVAVMQLQLMHRRRMTSRNCKLFEAALFNVKRGTSMKS